jgi:hypothetical protein
MIGTVIPISLRKSRYWCNRQNGDNFPLPGTESRRIRLLPQRQLTSLFEILILVPVFPMQIGCTRRVKLVQRGLFVYNFYIRLKALSLKPRITYK